MACDSPFEPQGDGERIPIGLVIEQDVTSDSARFYSFATDRNAVYAVYLQALEGDVWLRITDSTGFHTLVNLTARPNSSTPRLEDNAVAGFGSGETPQVYKITVQHVGAGTTSRFRFKIYQVNTNPEHVSRLVGIGNTVEGETIDPRVDLDRFVVMGTAGQEVVFVGETPAPVGSGSVSFTLIDTVAQEFLGYVFADAGPPTMTTGRMRLPATRGYSLVVGSVISNVYPRYGGPYRFWSYVINRAPEHRAAPLPLNAEVVDERIDREGDIDEFTFSASTGDEFNVFVQAPRAFQLEVARPGAAAFALATAVPTDTALYLHSTGRFSTSQSGAYVVRVSGSGSHQIADTGRYRVYLYPIDRQPEHVPAAIAIGDTVSGEQIELPGDIDEFSFTGTAGEEINAFFQAEDGTQETSLQLDILQPAGTVLRSVASIGTDTTLLRQATGTFVLPSTGTYRIRVHRPSPTYMDRSRGPYRFFLYRINRAPENSPATFAMGDSITGEAIHLPGDIDEFSFSAAQTTLAAFALARTGPELVPFVQCLRVELEADNGQPILDKGVPQYCGTTTELTLGTGPFVVPAGSHTLRVQGTASTGSGYTGAYRVVTFSLDSLPESVAGGVAIGDTVTGEDLGLPGDYDVFHFSGQAGQHIDIRLQGLAPSADSVGRWILASLSGPTGYLIFTSTPLSSATLDEHRTGRVDLPATGTYRLVVLPGHDGHLLDEVGAYRFAVVGVPAGPETAPATLSPGDSVTIERIDDPEDVDGFVLTGLPNQELAVFLHAGETQGLTVVVYDTATGRILDATPSFVARESTGRFRLTSSGVVGIRVYSPRPCPPEVGAEFGGCATAQALGSYFLKTVSINRAPEIASSVIVVGDTIDGEAIDPRGDVDEFTVSGTQGQHLTAYFQTPQGSGYPGVVLRVIDGTGAVLGSVASLNPTPALEDQSTGSIELPYTGAYTIRVEGADDRWGAGSYRFKIVLQ